MARLGIIERQLLRISAAVHVEHEKCDKKLCVPAFSANIPLKIQYMLGLFAETVDDKKFLQILKRYILI